MIEEIKTAGQAVKDWAESGFSTRDTAEQERIQEICNDCVEFHDPALNRCKHCGCFLKAKIAMPLQHCPINKW